MELNPLLLLALVWLVVSMLSRSGRKPPRVERRPQLPDPLAPSRRTGLDPTQREGTRLELMLGELQRAMEQARAQDYSGDIKLPGSDPEETQSLEVEPEVQSLESAAPREARRTVDQDDEAEAIEARRIQAALSRESGRKVDNRVAPEPIKREPADHTAVRPYTPEQLRHAVVWREILGPPVGER